MIEYSSISILIKHFTYESLLHYNIVYVLLGHVIEDHWFVFILLLAWLRLKRNDIQHIVVICCCVYGKEYAENNKKCNKMSTVYQVRGRKRALEQKWGIDTLYIRQWVSLKTTHIRVVLVVWYSNNDYNKKGKIVADMEPY